MRENEQKKSCENCRHYLEHFVKLDTRFQRINCGHCLNRINKKKLVLCEDWEDIAIQKEERKNSIKKTLESMSERLNEISFILKDDEN